MMTYDEVKFELSSCYCVSCSGELCDFCNKTVHPKLNKVMKVLGYVPFIERTLRKRYLHELRKIDLVLGNDTEMSTREFVEKMFEKFDSQINGLTYQMSLKQKELDDANRRLIDEREKVLRTERTFTELLNKTKDQLAVVECSNQELRMLANVFSSVKELTKEGNKSRCAIVRRKGKPDEIRVWIKKANEKGSWKVKEKA